ncbi:unnamed protein product [Caenorhabditis auriculariae]|uniref:Adenosine 5'-monophosphoramidase HINT3 n=1 Tax=Caenorhabditis auriculariae TaxID=2777116 RepID=A0A8S1HAK9_9PELO|nr:unnamed protein product [Caenorhabditis auriculariae]
MVTSVAGCRFCEIAHHRKEVQLRSKERCVVIEDINPKARYHFLVLSKTHIPRPTDLTAADIPLIEEMESTGRELLRATLKANGEADTVEDMLRIGFHYPPMISINHLHMHLIYPLSTMGLISRTLTFRPGKVFKSTGQVVEALRKAAGLPHPLEGNPAKNDNADELPAHAVAN